MIELPDVSAVASRMRTFWSTTATVTAAFCVVALPAASAALIWKLCKPPWAVVGVQFSTPVAALMVAPAGAFTSA